MHRFAQKNGQMFAIEDTFTPSGDLITPLIQSVDVPEKPA